MSESRHFVLESQRLQFCLMQATDIDLLCRLDLDAEVRAHFPDGVASRETVKRRISDNRRCFREHGYCDFLLLSKADGAFVGRAGFGALDDGEVEVGYVLMKEFWGQGLAQEALRALLNWARSNLVLPRILAYASVQHSASINVMRKCGMRHAGCRILRGVPCEVYEFPLNT